MVPPIVLHRLVAGILIHSSAGRDSHDSVRRRILAGRAALCPFQVYSALGVAWGIAHIGMEFQMGERSFKPALPLTILWAVVLALSVKQHRWTQYGAVLLGAAGCYWVAAMHYNLPTDFVGPLPWVSDPEHAGSVWSGPYNILLYVGIAIGLAILWTGARHIRREQDSNPASFALFVGCILMGGGAASVVMHTGLHFFLAGGQDWVLDSLAWKIGVGFVAYTVMLAASTARPAT